MCENQPEPRSCTECPQYDGMKCTATDFTLGDRDEVLYQEHRRGFICLDTGEAELKGDAAIQWTAEQERLCQEKGYKSCEEMWAAEGKQVKTGFRLDADNEHLEPMLQVSNGPGPVKPTFQYEENAKSVDDTMYHPNSATADCIADMLHKGEGGPFTSIFTGAKMPDGIIHMVDCNPAHAQFLYRPEALPKYAGSPSSECPSLREGPPQKGKIDENNLSDAPLIPGGTIVAGEGIQVIENPGPMWKDTNGYWEPVRPRSCTNCKLYNDPICMKIGTHIGNREEMWAREKRDGFQCIAALPKEEREAVITSNGCNNRKEIR